MTLEELNNTPQYMLLNCISGSNSYGLALPTSDVDYKGVFYLPKQQFYSLDYTEQVSNETNDIVYYELRRFIDLLYKNNPNILELLNTPADCVLYRHPIMDAVKPEIFLSKICKDSFAGYAMTQVKRAKGLNKKIVNPVDEKLKSVLDFCYVPTGQGTIPLSNWLDKQGYQQSDCGLVSLAHMRDMYALYHRSQFDDDIHMRGIISGEKANEVSLTSIPAGIEPLIVMYSNKDGYSRYCKEYHDYWEWVGKRNEVRYQGTLEHGKNYDAKNMMHVFRLLNMAEEIAREKKVNVRRHDREYLLSIRSGKFQYDDLVKQANDKVALITELYAQCDLPDKPDKNAINELLIQLREQLYN